MTLPIPKEYFDQVTQGFLVPNPHYQSGVHNGCDWATPVGTPLVAPCDGEITHRYLNHPALGKAIYFACDNESRYIRFLHLSEVAPQGKYKQGDVIGKTGNTGDTTGPHLHCDVWTVPINAGLITTPAGVRKYLLDPLTFFV
jgi:murein DD-endopeptidase MepM/ murein hydrolase activator NlpD